MLTLFVLHQFFDGAGDASIPQAEGIQDYRPTRFRTAVAPLRAAGRYYLSHDPDLEIAPDEFYFVPIVYAIVTAPIRAAALYYRGDDAGAGDAPADTAIFYPIFRSGTRRR